MPLTNLTNSVKKFVKKNSPVVDDDYITLRIKKVKRIRFVFSTPGSTDLIYNDVIVSRSHGPIYVLYSNDYKHRTHIMNKNILYIEEELDSDAQDSNARNT